MFVALFPPSRPTAWARSVKARSPAAAGKPEAIASANAERADSSGMTRSPNSDADSSPRAKHRPRLCPSCDSFRGPTTPGAVRTRAPGQYKETGEDLKAC